MKCSEVRRLVSPYLDSELDETTQFEIARHLDGCSECAARFRAEEGLEHAVDQALRRTAGDEEEILRAALRRALGRSAGSRARRAFAACALLLAAGLLALLVWRSFAPREGSVPALVVAAARDHVQSLPTPHAPELGGGSREAIDGFLRAEIGAQLGPLHIDEPWTLEGVRRCRLGNTRVGLVSLRCGAEPVSLFVVPPSAPLADAPALGSCRVYRMTETNAVIQTIDGCTRLAVGNVETERLRDLLEVP